MGPLDDAVILETRIHTGIKCWPVEDENWLQHILFSCITFSFLGFSWKSLWLHKDERGEKGKRGITSRRVPPWWIYHDPIRESTNELSQHNAICMGVDIILISKISEVWINHSEVAKMKDVVFYFPFQVLFDQLAHLSPEYVLQVYVDRLIVAFVAR